MVNAVRSQSQMCIRDRLQAADVSFPDAVRKVAVINNMPVLKTKDNHEILSSELEEMCIRDRRASFDSA